MKRVWIVANISTTIPGGMRRHMELHASGLQEAGVEARLLVAPDSLQRPQALTHRLPGLALLLPNLALLRRESPDVVNVHTLCAPSWIAARRAGLFSSKVVVMSYAADERGMSLGTGAMDTLRRSRVAVPARRTFPHASGIWCVNTDDAAYYEQEYGIPKTRIAVIPHAAADNFYEPAPIARDGQRLLFVGTLLHRKGVDVLASALPRVLRERPGVTVAIAGCLSTGDDFLQHIPEDLRARVQIHARVDDQQLRTLYHGSGLLLVPSRIEGLPFSLLEALACGLPSLSARNSGMKDVVVEGHNGWLLDGFDPARWAERILELLAAPAALEQASKGARESAEAFRRMTLTRRTLAWYESL